MWAWGVGQPRGHGGVPALSESSPLPQAVGRPTLCWAPMVSPASAPAPWASSSRPSRTPAVTWSTRSPCPTSRYGRGVGGQSPSPGRAGDSEWHMAPSQISLCPAWDAVSPWVPTLGEGCAQLLHLAQIYNEMIRDLLNPSLGCLQLREDAGGTVQVAGITEVSAINADEVSQQVLLGHGGGAESSKPPPAQRCPSAPGHAAAGAREQAADAGAHGRQPHLVTLPRGAAGHRAPAAPGQGAAPRPPLYDRPGRL